MTRSRAVLATSPPRRGARALRLPRRAGRGLRQQGPRRHRGAGLPHPHRGPRRPAAAARRSAGSLQRRGPRAAALLRLGRPSPGFLRRRDDDQSSARLAEAPDRPARRGLPEAVQRRRPVLSLHGAARGRRIPRHRGNRDSARPRDFGARPMPRFSRQPHAPGRHRRRARDAQGRVRPVRADARRRRLVLGGAHAASSGDRRDRGAPHLEASDAPAGTLVREARAHPRLRVPQVGRPPRQDVHRRGAGHGRRAPLQGPHRLSVHGALRVSVRGGRPRAAGDRGAAHRRARPPRRAEESIRGPRRGRGPSTGPGAIRRLALLQGPLVYGRLSLPGRRVPASISPPTSLPARTPSSASTRPTTPRASSSTSRPRRRSSGTAGT